MYKRLNRLSRVITPCLAFGLANLYQAACQKYNPGLADWFAGLARNILCLMLYPARGCYNLHYNLKMRA
jgi:hypothetical protein